jgi:hypothetical protein
LLTVDVPDDVPERLCDNALPGRRGSDPGGCRAHAHGARAAHGIRDELELNGQPLGKFGELDALQLARMKKHILTVSRADESTRTAANDLRNPTGHGICSGKLMVKVEDPETVGNTTITNAERATSPSTVCFGEGR